MRINPGVFFLLDPKSFHQKILMLTTEHLGKKQLFSSMFECITSFTKKLEPFIEQIKTGKIVNFYNVSEREKMFSVYWEKYTKLCENFLESLK